MTTRGCSRVLGGPGVAEMALWFRHGETGERDRYNRPIVGLTPAGALPIKAFDPGSSAEPRSGTSHRVNTKPTLYLRSDPGIGPQDEFEIRGRRYQVAGDAGAWVSPYIGRLAGVEVALQRVVG